MKLLSTLLKRYCVLAVSLLLSWNTSLGQSAVYGPVAESLQNSAHQLFISADGNYYKQNNTNNDNFNYWWNAHAVDALADGYLRTRADVYKQRMKNILRGIKIRNGNTYINEYYDDMEWLAISSLRSYEHTGDAEYLNVANLLWTDIKTGIHPERGGAIQWKKDSPGSFNACANGPAIIFAVRLYRTNGNAQDLQIAKNIYTWQKNVLVDPVNGAVWDSYNANTNETNKSWIFSYNVGTWIGGCLELYKATGDQSYLNDAVKTADYAVNTRLANGVFWTNETGAGDGGLFKGIFVRYFALLAREGNLPATTRERYVNALASSAAGLKNQGINTTNMLVNPNWTTRPGTTTDHSTQQSGVMLMEAAATLDQSFFYKDVNYGRAGIGLVAGSYRLSDLMARGIANDDISSFTLPAGYTVTFYEHDNFTGANTVRNSSSMWIGTDWNDRVSSLIITAPPPAAARVQAKVDQQPAAGDNKLQVFPNPFKDQLGISVADSKGQQLEVHVYDANGRNVLPLKHIHSGQQLDLSLLPPGVYILTVKTGKGVLTTKVLKH
ncbi:T9SS type A sorting domain-containing protein [Chitinophaga pendula]|uniref:glycoside hydrolase family 76 protein n=1 Tax=Chitinophaga TaxID=79328 RepID=UPI000BAF7BE5|nr:MULTISPECIES: glycoside hydrolase family 76 protein [Chitinophaga]ASZ10745.1 hypothetical protein CK934_07005 [Chitinophaga sp. MD30]UCJ06280.1 T9SS type A sorting domain-containing protein [Chitinophaga pendula]